MITDARLQDDDAMLSKQISNNMDTDDRINNSTISVGHMCREKFQIRKNTVGRRKSRRHDYRDDDIKGTAADCGMGYCSAAN